jgi:hypothetical protein
MSFLGGERPVMKPEKALRHSSCFSPRHTLLGAANEGRGAAANSIG